LFLVIHEFHCKIPEYSLLTSIYLQKKDKEIWVRYNDEPVSLPENVLKVLKVSNVEELKRMIKARFSISENITIRNGNVNLEDSILVTELYNMEDNAFEVIVEGNGMHKIVVLKILIPTH